MKTLTSIQRVLKRWKIWNLTQQWKIFIFRRLAVSKIVFQSFIRTVRNMNLKKHRRHFCKKTLLLRSSMDFFVVTTKLEDRNWTFLFLYHGFLWRTLMTYRTASGGREPSFIPLYLFHSLTNIQTFICNFACEMTITYF